MIFCIWIKIKNYLISVQFVITSIKNAFLNKKGHFDSDTNYLTLNANKNLSSSDFYGFEIQGSTLPQFFVPQFAFNAGKSLLPSLSTKIRLCYSPKMYYASSEWQYSFDFLSAKQTIFTSFTVILNLQMRLEIFHHYRLILSIYIYI